MKVGKLIVLGILLLIAFPAFAAERLKVYTVNYPLAYFAERIGGEQVEVVFPAPVDVDPAYWLPDQQTIAAYQQADLILLNGANYAKWIGKVSLPRGKMVDTSRKFKDRYVYTSAVTTHSHGATGAHAHESLAFTTWLDLRLAKLQAEAIYKALSRKQPMSETSFKRNYQSLADELDSLDQHIRKVVSKQNQRPLVGSHPVYDYLVTGYDLNLKSVHWEPDELPTTSQVNELKKNLAEHHAKWMIWEASPEIEAISILKNIGMGSLVFDPCGNRPVEGDFLSVMEQNVGNLAKAFDK